MGAGDMTGGPDVGRFRSWDTRASVRTATRRIFNPSEAGRVYFPGWASPYLSHPHVIALDDAARKRLAIDYLYQYLLFTVRLEVEIVNDVVGRLATGSIGDLPPDARARALQIYCDEAYHAVANLDLLEQVAACTAVPVPAAGFDDVSGSLVAIGERLLPGNPELAEQLRVIVFETVVTSILSAVSRDPTVFSAIREVVHDHAVDERRHHAFFIRYLTILWPQIPGQLRPAVAACIPELISACLRWDARPARASLDRVGLSAGEVAEVIADCYSEPRVAASLRRSARHLIARCGDLGVTQLPAGAAAFRRYGLLGEAVLP
jgi:hypothetical protein